MRPEVGIDSDFVRSRSSKEVDTMAAAPVPNLRAQNAVIRPTLIQGGMGVAVSDWRLAKAWLSRELKKHKNN